MVVAPAPIYLTGGGQEEPGAGSLSQAQHVHGTQKAGLQGLDGVVPSHHIALRACYAAHSAWQ